MIIPAGVHASPITGVPGPDTLAEQNLLFELAQAIPGAAFIVEIGAEYGMSASLFLAGNSDPGTLVHSIDLFPGDLRSAYIANLIEAGFGQEINGQVHLMRAIAVQGSSHQVAGHDWVGQRPIDLLFIDGDHSYNSVVQDIIDWTPHVAIGGKVAFHDCLCPHNFMRDYMFQFDVTWAVCQWVIRSRGAFVQYAQADSLMVFERVK